MAKGLGGLLGVGREQKRQALAGLTRAAQLETQTDTINRQLKAQKRAAEMNVLGTAGGIVGAQALSGGLKFGKAAADTAAATTAATGGAAAAGGTAAGTAAAGGAAAGTAAGTAAAGGAASAGMMAGMAAAAPYVLLAIAGGYLLKKIFD